MIDPSSETQTTTSDEADGAASIASVAPVIETPLTPDATDAAAIAETVARPLSNPVATLLAPLRHRNFSLLFAGQLISVIGDMFYSVALPWYMLTRGGGPANLGLVLTAYGIPLMVTSLLGGWLSDRFRPRRVMLASDAIRMLIVGAIAAAIFQGHATLVLLAALSATLGAFDGVFLPASSAITPDVLPDEELQAGNSLSYVWNQAARLLGPALAGLIVARFAPGWALAIDAATFGVSTITLALMRPRRTKTARTGADQGRETAPVTTGAAASDTTPPVTFGRYLLGSRLLQVLFVITLVGNFINGLAEVAIPSLAHLTLHTDATGFGALLVAMGAGSLVGAILAGMLKGRAQRGIVAVWFFTIQSFFIVGVGLATSLWFAVGSMALFGLFNGLGNVSFVTLVQRKLPRHLLGRIMGVFGFTNFALYPISVAVSGFAVARYGPGPVIIAGAIVTLAAISMGFVSREVREL